MTTRQVQLVKDSWANVSQLDTVVVGGLFYNRLFEIAPELRSLFRSTEISLQSKKLLAMMGYIINKLDILDEIMDEVAKLAQRHVHYGVKDEHYTLVGKAMLWTLEKGLDADWTHEVEQAWIACYTVLASAMVQAGWEAERE